MKKLFVITLMISGLSLYSCGGNNTAESHHHTDSESVNHEKTEPSAPDSHEHEHEHTNNTEAVKLNNGAKWQADAPTNQAIADLILMTKSSENNSTLKDKLMGRINQLFKECTMTGEADEQLHHYLIPLINKIKGLNDKSSHDFDTQKKDILAYLKTYQDYFK